MESHERSDCLGISFSPETGGKRERAADRVYRAVAAHIRDFGRGPTHTDLKRALPGHEINHNLLRLWKRGLVDWDDGVPGSLRLVERQ